MSKDVTPIRERDPHFDKLEILYDQNYPRMTKSSIFEQWEKMIYPDEPQITEKQYVNWTRHKDTEKLKKKRAKERAIETGAFASYTLNKEASLIELEKMVRGGREILLKDALVTLGNEHATLDEKKYALSVITQTEKGLQGEKGLALKAHREKRETAGLFAKLASQAMSGDISMEEVQALIDSGDLDVDDISEEELEAIERGEI